MSLLVLTYHPKIEMMKLKHLATARGLIVAFCYFLTAVFFFLHFSAASICAHSPHDVIDAIALSPIYHKDKTVFIAMEGALRRSGDGGSSWKDIVNGLDNKFPFTSIAISPNFQIDKTLLAATSGDGIYRSKDGGSSWVEVNSGLRNLNINRITIFISNHVSMSFAADTGGNLYKTENWGDKWHTVLDQIKVRAIAFSPDRQKNHLLAGDSNGSLYISKDLGDSWLPFYQDESWGAVNDITISPVVGADHTFFVGTQKAGVLKTINYGASFFPINGGLPAKANIQSLAISPDYANDRTVFASSWQKAAFRSDNGGETWRKYDSGLTLDKQANTNKYRSPHFRNLRISNNYRQDNTIFLGGFDGLFKSTNRGQIWTQLETLTVGRIMDLAISPAFGIDYHILITTYGGGAYATQNSELKWTIRNKGLRQTRLTDISFSPNYSEDLTVFSAARGHLLKSKKDSPTWQRINTRPGGFASIKRRVLKKLRGMGFPESITTGFLSDAEKNILYPTVLAVSPNFAEDQTIFFGTRRNGLFSSDKGGHRVKIIEPKFGLVNSLALSPDIERDGILFISARGKGIFRSTDSGKTWHSVHNEMNFVNAWSNGSDEGIPSSTDIGRLPYYDIKLTVSPAFKKDRTIFAACGEGLFKSIDAGDSWRRLSLPPQNKTDYILTTAVSPNYSENPTVLVSVKGKGLYKSSDGGGEFFRLGQDLIKANYLIYHIEFSPNYLSDNTIFAASEEELFRSSNGGETWQVIKRPVRYENHRDVIVYGENWKIIRDPEYSAGSASYGYAENSTVRFNFVGTGIRIIGAKSNLLNGCTIYLDGELTGTLNQYDVSDAKSISNYSIENLAYGPHHMMLVVQKSEQKNSKAGGIIIDAFDVLGRHGRF